MAAARKPADGCLSRFPGQFGGLRLPGKSQDDGVSHIGTVGFPEPWRFGVGLPAAQAADVRAAEQTSKDAAAKKKEDSDAFWAKVQADNRQLREQQAKDTAARNAAQAADHAAGLAGTSESIRTQMEAQGWTRCSGPYYYQ